MHTNSSRGTFEDLFPLLPVPIAHIAYHLRGLIGDIYSNTTEIPKPKENHADYAVGSGKRNEIFGYICPMEKYVRLGFYYGGALPDPAGLMVGEGKVGNSVSALRHVKIYSLAEAERPEICALIQAAVQERKSALGVK
ncbi:MAG TPA: hypothetical protein VI451_06565 [Anaerolineales bacterium]|nr:hypothetical protein [Anaerolineales bacterium]